MKISRRSVLHISGLAAAALALTGCSAAGSAALGGKLPGLLKGLAKKGETAASSEAASDMAVTPPPEGEQLDPAFGVMPEYDADILTGAARSTNSRPVAVMVNNIANSQRQNARPQRGIGSADLLIEAKVEGGITRLCAVFSDADSIPEVGPIRSGRDQFLQLLMPWDILYYHDGESIFCTQFVSVYGYSGLNIGGKNYFKTPIHPIVSHRNNRGRDVAYEHTEFTSGKEICKAASDAGISLYAPSEGTFFHFADYRTDEVNKLKGEPSAKKIAIVHSESYRTSFSYSALSHTYAMQMYNSSKKATENTVDELTGEQIAYKNIILQYSSWRKYDENGYLNIDVDEPNVGKYIVNGKAIDITWKKHTPWGATFYYDTNGNQITMDTGKTWVCIIQDTYADRVEILGSDDNSDTSADTQGSEEQAAAEEAAASDTEY